MILRVVVMKDKHKDKHKEKEKKEKCKGTSKVKKIDQEHTEVASHHEGPMVESKLCKIIKNGEHKNNLEEYKGLIDKGEYVCGKCGRVANSKKNLCNGLSLR